jgi:hypothetical protein
MELIDGRKERKNVSRTMMGKEKEQPLSLPFWDS